MCLHTKWPKEKTQEWLNQQPGNTITGYKSVAIREKNKKEEENVVTSPYFISQMPLTGYKRKNKKTFKQIITTKKLYLENKQCYKPHYHFFKKLRDLKSWTSHEDHLKCTIPKKAITTIGTLKGKMVIVATEFEFEEKKFKEMKTRKLLYY